MATQFHQPGLAQTQRRPDALAGVATSGFSSVGELFLSPTSTQRQPAGGKISARINRVSRLLRCPGQYQLTLTIR